MPSLENYDDNRNVQYFEELIILFLFVVRNTRSLSLLAGNTIWSQRQ